jgi:hypothetical protein
VEAAPFTCGAVISSGHDDGDALRYGLLPERIVESVAGCAKGLFATTVGIGEDGCDSIVDGVGGSEINAIGGRRGAGNDEINCGAGSDGAGPLDIEHGFLHINRRGDTRIGAADENVWIIRFEAEDLTELLDVRKFDIRLCGDRDGNAGAIVAGAEEWLSVVDRCEVAGREVIEIGIAHGGEFRRENGFLSLRISTGSS